MRLANLLTPFFYIVPPELRRPAQPGAASKAPRAQTERDAMML